MGWCWRIGVIDVWETAKSDADLKFKLPKVCYFYPHLTTSTLLRFREIAIAAINKAQALPDSRRAVHEIFCGWGYSGDCLWKQTYSSIANLPGFAY